MDASPARSIRPCFVRKLRIQRRSRVRALRPVQFSRTDQLSQGRQWLPVQTKRGTKSCLTKTKPRRPRSLGSKSAMFRPQSGRAALKKALSSMSAFNAATRPRTETGETVTASISTACWPFSTPSSWRSTRFWNFAMPMFQTSPPRKPRDLIISIRRMKFPADPGGGGSSRSAALFLFAHGFFQFPPARGGDIQHHSCPYARFVQGMALVRLSRPVRVARPEIKPGVLLHGFRAGPGNRRPALPGILDDIRPAPRLPFRSLQVYLHRTPESTRRVPRSPPRVPPLLGNRHCAGTVLRLERQRRLKHRPAHLHCRQQRHIRISS